MRDGVLSVEARIGFVSGLSIPVAGADGTVWDSVPAAQGAIEQATWWTIFSCGVGVRFVRQSSV
jgi:hypothetical protein